MKNYSIRELSISDTYRDDEELWALSAKVAKSNYDTIGRAADLPRGDFKRAVLAGKFPELVKAAIDAGIAADKAREDSLSNAAITLYSLVLPAGWKADISIQDNCINLTGPYDAEMPARLRRAGGKFSSFNKTWVLPLDKASSLKRIFANAQKANAQKPTTPAIEAVKQFAPAPEQKPEQEKRFIAKVKIRAGSMKIGDKLNGEIITGFGKIWTESIRVTDDTACVYGMQPGLDYYPNVNLQFQYAYFN